MSEVEVFLDDTPGEVRGMVARDSRFHHLIIHRDDEPPQHRLGARVVGRVTEVEPAFDAAFVDLGTDAAPGFVPLKGRRLNVGDRIEAEVTAEPRESKGPTLTWTGTGEGAPRVLSPGPDVPAILARLAPDIEIQRGITAIQAAWEAEEEALSSGAVFPETGIDLAVQRTRALIAVDIDHAPFQGRDAARARTRANIEGLRQGARLIRLKSWGGLICVDLVGTRLDGEALGRAARDAFQEPDMAVGPVSRFGLMQLAIPWRRRPVEEILCPRGGADASVRAMAGLRHLRHALLSDHSIPRLILSCAPDEAVIATRLAAALGPRAGVRADSGVAPGKFQIREV